MKSEVTIVAHIKRLPTGMFEASIGGFEERQESLGPGTALGDLCYFIAENPEDDEPSFLSLFEEDEDAD